MRSVRERRTGCVVLLLLLLAAVVTRIVQVRIMEGVERDIGFTEMDSTVAHSRALVSVAAAGRLTRGGGVAV